ncbi:MAG: hypothetical protein O2887_15300 [Bacteroidetes bacterium]|nr:hypothetical protein [Bacteroidota bacterium]MDA1121829.1 hypothetical protein [Bacteroidota bacterium]
MNGEELPLPEQGQHISTKNTRHSIWLWSIIAFIAISIFNKLVKGKVGKAIAFVVIFALGWFFANLVFGLIIGVITLVLSAGSRAVQVDTTGAAIMAGVVVATVVAVDLAVLVAAEVVSAAEVLPEVGNLI